MLPQNNLLSGNNLLDCNLLSGSAGFSVLLLETKLHFMMEDTHPPLLGCFCWNKKEHRNFNLKPIHTKNHLKAKRSSVQVEAALLVNETVDLPLHPPLYTNRSQTKIGLTYHVFEIIKTPVSISKHGLDGYLYDRQFVLLIYHWSLQLRQTCSQRPCPKVINLAILTDRDSCALAMLLWILTDLVSQWRTKRGKCWTRGHQSQQHKTVRKCGDDHLDRECHDWNLTSPSKSSVLSSLQLFLNLLWFHGNPCLWNTTRWVWKK